MKFLVILTIVLIPASITLAGSPIIVSDVPIFPTKTPATFKTVEEYERWAEATNHLAEAECRARAASTRQARLDRGEPTVRTAHLVETSGSSRSQRGGGYGAGGYGGAGGYLGYGNSVAGGMYGRYGGIGSAGNVVQSGFTQATREYDITYPDLNDGGGGPLFIINPYCIPDYLKLLRGSP